MNFKTIMPLVIALLLLSISIFWLTSQRDTTNAPQDTFVIGTVGNYAPFVSMNAQGEYVGFDIDVAKALAQNLGKKLIIKDLGSMASLFIALEQGSIDAIIWGLSITKARLLKVAMIRYQGENVNAYPLIFWKEIPKGIKSINDMKGMTVCVEPASSQDAVLRSYPDIKILQTERVDDALLNIQYGKANAALVEPAIAAKFKNKYPEIQLFDVPLNEEFQVMGTGIAIKKDNSALIEAVQRAIDDLQKQGTLGAFEQRWGI